MLDFIKGGTFVRRVALRDTGGRSVDLTGVSVTLENAAGGAVLAGMICQVDPNAPTTGLVFVSAESASTAAWPLGVSSYRVRITFPDGIVVMTPAFAFEVKA